jgi:hypothetical protein
VKSCPEWRKTHWTEPGFGLERHILDWEAKPNEYLLPRRTVRPNQHKPGEKFIAEYRTEPMGVHGLHENRPSGESFPPRLPGFGSTKRAMRLAGIEPATSRSGGARSIP